MFSFQKRFALLFASAILMPLAPAIAADYDPPVVVDQPDEYVPVEVGSGWYLRGDVGYNLETDFVDRQVAFANQFVDIAPFAPSDLTGFEHKENGFFGSAGVGYHFNDFLRADLNLGILPNEQFGTMGTIGNGCAGTETTTVTNFDATGAQVGNPVVNTARGSRDCYGNLTAKNTFWTGTVNGYIDLGTYAGLTPYIGGGVGLIYSKNEIKGSADCLGTTSSSGSASQSTVVGFSCDGSTNSSGNATYVGAKYADRDYQLMYQAAAGVSYQIARNTSIDFGYQYTTAPDTRYVMVDQSGIITGKGIDYHQIKFGLRYDLW